MLITVSVYHSTWIKNKDKILATSDSSNHEQTSQRAPQHPDTEAALLEWTNKDAISIPILMIHLVIVNLEVQPVGWTTLSRGMELSSNAVLAISSAAVTSGRKPLCWKHYGSTVQGTFITCTAGCIWNVFHMTPDKTLAFKDYSCQGLKVEKSLNSK